MPTTICKQRGFALIAVMIIGTVAMYGVTPLLGNSTVVERRLQDEELLKLRAYWAAQGHISYAISRSRQGPPCGGTCKGALAQRKSSWVGYFSELDEGGGFREWNYPEISSNYTFPVAVLVGTDGALIAPTVSYPAAITSNPLISQNWPVRRDVKVLICVGLTNPGDPCPASVAQMDKASGISFVSRFEPL